MEYFGRIWSSTFEKINEGNKNQSISKKIQGNAMQLSFFKLDDPVLEQIKEEILKADVNNLTPVEALMKLNEIKKLIGG